MGDAQSAQREGKKDAAAEEESGKVEDALTEQAVEDKPLKNTGQIPEINGKADGSIAEVNGHCKDEIAAEAILSPDEDFSATEKPLQEEVKPLENDEINQKKPADEADANEDVPLEMTEMDAKQNDINDGFRKFFSNIGLKLTVKRGSVDTATDVPDKTNKEEPSIPEEVEDAAKESKSENAEQNTDVNIAQETYDNDSTTCPTMTDATSEDAVENAEEKTTETKEEVESHEADAATSTVGEDAHQEATPEEEPHETSPSGADVDAASPIKRFFTTGIFSGLGKKKKRPAEDETTEKELVDMGKKEVIETAEQTVEDQQQDKEEFTPGVEAEHKENELKEEIASAQETDEGKSSSRDLSESSPQEKEKVQSSPLKRLLSGSSFKKIPKKQRSRRSSDTKLSDSGEHVSDQLASSTESAENRKQEGPEQREEEEDGAWASFKKLMTPKKRVKRSSLTNEETQISVPVEPKPSEGEQISDHSTEEGKKRKDSSVSWEAVLCGSGRRRSRKTSDSEDETPQADGSKHGAESPLEGSNEHDIDASSPKQAGSPSESDGGSTWNSLKRLVTPKRKAKDEDESKEIIQSDSEVTQDESSFSLKKLLPGRKKRKSAEKQDRASSGEADRDVASGDEDSETPAVVPLSEFDTDETYTGKTQADIESHIPEEANYELQKDLPDQMAEPVLPCESLQTEAITVPDTYAAVEKQVPTTPAANTEPDDETESTSSHQQLSDIPEEGIITDTMVTPASVAEEAARDDTLAEDLIEITSEAITAPEPASGITLADETEMISAVSQLSSESSKTSGNTTPVPAEYEVAETDTLLYQVVETISISPKSVPVYSDGPSSEQIVGSASNQILEKFEIEEPTILEIHRRSDATDARLNVEELDASNELAATSRTESTSEVVSEVTTEEFNTAEIPVDEKQGVSVTHPEESVKECEQIDESRDLVEGLSEINAAVPTDKLMKLNESSAVQGDILDSEEGIVRSQEVISEDKLAAETVIDELKEETEPGKEDEPVQDVAKTEQVQVPEELEAVKASTLDSEETSVQSPEEEVKSKDSPPAEAVTDEPKQTAEHLTEVSVEPENQELPVKAVRTDHVEEPEVLEAAEEPILDSVDGSVQSLEKEAIVDLPKAETVTCEPEHETIPLDEPVDASKTDDVQEPEVLQAVQAPVSEAGSLEKEVTSEEIPGVETLADESKQEADVEVEPEEKLPVEAVQASTLDSEDSSLKSLEKEVISADVPEAERVTDEPKEEKIPLTEPEDVSKTEDVQEPEVLQAEATPTSNTGSLLSLEKEETKEDIPAEEKVTDELKGEAKVEVELEEKLASEAAKTEHIQEPQALEAVQASTLDSEDSSVKALEKEVISADVPEAETVTDEPKEEKIPLTEPEDVSKTEDVQEPEVLQTVATPTSDAGGPLSLEKEETSEDIPAEETVTDEPKQEAKIEAEPEEKLSLEAAKTEEEQEAETKTKEVGLQSHTVTEEETLLEDVPKPDADNLIASVADEIESKVLPQLGRALEKTEDQESISKDVQVEQEDSIPEAVDELQTQTAVHVSPVNEEASNVQDLEKTVFSGETATVCVTEEPKQGMQLGEEQDSVEQEKESKIPDGEIKPAEVKPSLVAPVVVCDLKGVLVAVPDVLIEKTSEMTEPLKETVASEVVLKEEVVETVVPLGNEDTAETTGEIEMTHVPSVTLEEHHRSQAQVVDADTKSAETIDSVPEGGVTVTKEVTDVCNEMGKNVDSLSTTPAIEEELIHEEHKVTIQEVTQHVVEELAETEPESVVANFEQEVIEQPVAVTKISEMAESESNDVEDQTAAEESVESSRERQDEATAVISDDSATEPQLSKDLMQTPDLPESLDASIHDHKEDLEQTKAEQEKLQVGITGKEVKSSSEEAQITQVSQSAIVTPSNTGLVIPQNTGIISSVGNVESPSSLSLEFKLNIQFGQPKAPFSPPPATERIALVKQTAVPEVGVQAVNAEEPVKPINPTQRLESQKQTELTSVAVQAVQITEATAKLDSRENGVITPQPVLQDVGIQVMETVQPVEQIESTETVTCSVQATETIHPIRPTEQREVFVSQEVLCKDHDQEPKEEEPVKKTEEENDQDVWMDAEEVIYTQEKTEVFLEVNEPQEPQTGSEQEEETGLGREAETAPDSKTAEEESPQEMHKTGGNCEIESEGEDFAVALEDLEPAAVSVTTMDFD